jgi:hypothetical protein
MFKRMTIWAKNFDIRGPVIGPISVTMMTVQNAWLSIPTAALAFWKRSFQIDRWLAKCSAFEQSEVELFLSEAKHAGTFVGAKAPLNLSGRSRVLFSALQALTHHIGLAATATIEASNRAKAHFRRWHDRKSFAAVLTASFNASFAKKSSRAFGAATLASNWPLPLESHATMGTFC